MSASVIAAFITGVLGPVLLMFLKNKYEKKDKPVIKNSDGENFF